MSRRVHVLLFSGCELLDVAGPVQALHEANALGAAYDLCYCAAEPDVRLAQGLALAALAPLPAVAAEDWVLVPGYPVATVRPAAAVVAWVRQAAAAGARICSVCTGAFLLGEAGLLDGRRCTTHWRRLAALRARYPRARVVDDRLYVADGTVVTSAGIASGIDMTLALLEEDAGPQLASAVAREMVVYLRRDGRERQESVYLSHQQHLSAGVHQVQQYLVANPASRATLEELAALAYMSPRHLTRSFRRATGLSIGEYRLRLRLERARHLLQQSDLKLDAVAAECGFADPRQLRRLWSRHYGRPPHASR